MSERVDIDTDALEHFVITLKTFNDALDSRWKGLMTSWDRTSDTWHDRKKDQFEGNVGTAGWQEVIDQMQGYLNASNQYYDYLRKLLERAQSFLET